jgi:hypothetical protein
MDASCTMGHLRSCEMHDYFVGDFILIELRAGLGCQKSTQATACNPVIV